jgi:hypothetical protein
VGRAEDGKDRGLESCLSSLVCRGRVVAITRLVAMHDVWALHLGGLDKLRGESIECLSTSRWMVVGMALMDGVASRSVYGPNEARLGR